MHTSLVGNPLKQLWSAYEKQLERRPVLTQMTTSAVLWGAGDLIAQRLEYWERQNDAQHLLAAATAVAQAKPVKAPHPKSSAETAANNSSKPQMEIDWQRAVLTGLFGALFVGPVGHYWYITLDKLCTRLVPGGGPSRIATKVLIDTAAMGPFYVSAFFAWGCALMDGSGWEGFTRKMKVDFLPTLAAEASFWPIIQTVNFSVVPLKHQLLVVNVMTIIDACFMSWARNQDDWLAKVQGILKRGAGEDEHQLQHNGVIAAQPLEVRTDTHKKRRQ